MGRKNRKNQFDPYCTPSKRNVLYFYRAFISLFPHIEFNSRICLGDICHHGFGTILFFCFRFFLKGLGWNIGYVSNVHRLHNYHFLYKFFTHYSKRFWLGTCVHFPCLGTFVWFSKYVLFENVFSKKQLIFLLVSLLGAKDFYNKTSMNLKLAALDEKRSMRTVPVLPLIV